MGGGGRRKTNGNASIANKRCGFITIGGAGAGLAKKMFKQGKASSTITTAMFLDGTGSHKRIRAGQTAKENNEKEIGGGGGEGHGGLKEGERIRKDSELCLSAPWVGSKEKNRKGAKKNGRRKNPNQVGGIHPEHAPNVICKQSGR